MSSIFNSSELGKGSQDNAFTEYDFLWLKNERAAHFTWLKLKSADYQAMVLMSGNTHLPTVPEGWVYFDYVTGAGGPGPSNKVIQEIILFFENWSVDVSTKKCLMSWLENAWSEVYLRNLVLKWIHEKDEEQCQWAWGYLVGRVPVCSLFKPTKARDLYLFSQAVIDVAPRRSESELFIIKFKKAWSQQVYRKKQVGKSSLNTYISQEAKAMLDSISEKREEKINVVLESVIRKTYRDEFL